MARPTRRRTRNLNLCPLVQHKPPSPRPGCHRTPTSRKPTRNTAKEGGLSAPTRDPGLGRLIKRRRHAGCYTRCVALHPLRGATPVTWRYTRYGTLHPLRGAAPDQNGCNAYGSGAPRSQARMTAEPGIPQRERRRPQRPYINPGTWQANLAATSRGALHQLRNTAPVTWRYTRSERVQCPRIGCNAHGSGVPRSQTRMTAEPGIPQRERTKPQRPYIESGTWQACDSP